MSERDDAIRAAMTATDQMTQDGKPEVSAINATLREHDFEPVTAQERDDAWAAYQAETAPGDKATGERSPTGRTCIRLTGAMSDPLIFYVHGVGRFDLRVGEEHVVPDEALEPLRNSDATFEVVGTA